MCGFHSITSLSHSIFCIHLRNCFPPSWSVRTWRKNKINMCLLKSLKEKALSLCVNGWGRKTKKNFARYLKANINILFCTINATIINMLMKRFHHDEKILMLSSSVICLSFTVLNIFKRRKVSRKTLVYSPVIDINQMDVIFCNKYI